MATDIDRRLSAIQTKGEMLIERFARLEAERLALAEERDGLRRRLDKALKEIETLKMKNEYLTMASTVLPSADDVEHSRRFLSELVWEIDKCISQLSE